LLADSGTSALRLAIEGAVAETGMPVGLPGYACYDLATAAEGAAAKVALYDLDPRTLGPDWESLRALSSKGVGAVVVAHLFGYPVDVRAAREIAGQAVVIEDAAQGAGGRLRGRLLGALGSVSVLSFGRGKGMTGGGGGALLAHDDRGAALLGWARGALRDSEPGAGVGKLAALLAQMVLGRPSVYGIPAAIPFLHLGETVYHRPWRPGPAPSASIAVLERTMNVSDRAVATRTAHATRLSRSVSRSPRAHAVRVLEGAEPGYLRLPVLLARDVPCEPMSTDAARLGITPMYPMTLDRLPSLGPHLAGPVPSLPGSRELVARLVTLPTHGLLGEEDLRAIEDWLRND
jgi:dTDP-4-amino-4,6-dideoxygalactose transaminase